MVRFPHFLFLFMYFQGFSGSNDFVSDSIGMLVCSLARLSTNDFTSRDDSTPRA